MEKLAVLAITGLSLSSMLLIMSKQSNSAFAGSFFTLIQLRPRQPSPDGMCKSSL